MGLLQPAAKLCLTLLLGQTQLMLSSAKSCMLVGDYEDAQRTYQVCPGMP